eukprot:664711-Pelagomonas_calceolata.AAC.5
MAACLTNTGCSRGMAAKAWVFPASLVAAKAWQQGHCSKGVSLSCTLVHSNGVLPHPACPITVL